MIPSRPTLYLRIGAASVFLGGLVASVLFPVQGFRCTGVELQACDRLHAAKQVGVGVAAFVVSMILVSLAGRGRSRP